MPSVFAISPSLVLSVSNRSPLAITRGWHNLSSGSTDANLLAAINGQILDLIEPQNGIVNSDNIVFGFDQGTAIFNLEDIGVVSFLDLPNGFLFTSLAFTCSGTNSGGVGGSVSLNLSQQVQTIIFSDPIIFNFPNLLPNDTLAPLTFLGFQFNFINALFALNAGGTLNNLVQFYGWNLSGSFRIFAYSWNIKNGTTPKRIVRSNLQPIKVTVQSPSDDDEGGGPTGDSTGGLDGIVIDDGTGISSIVISYYTPSGILKQRAIATEDIIVQEDIIFIFIINIILLQFFLDDLDIAINNTTFYLSATGNGIQFSGTVPLGTLNILLVDASGMYKVVSGKRNDTLYDGHDGDTFDSAIPNPFIKGGFIGG